MAEQQSKVPPPREGQGGKSAKDDLQEQFRAFQAQINGDRFRGEVMGALPMGLRKPAFVDQFCSTLYVSIRNNPLLLNYDRGSLIQAAIRIAQRGLKVDGSEAALVPYKGIVQDQLMYRGCLKLVRRSKLVTKITAQAAYLNDLLDISFGTHEDIIHKPYLDGERGELRGCYAWAMVREPGWEGEGVIEPEWMSWDEIDKIRQGAPSANSPAWRNNPGEMGRKTVLKRLCKRLPVEDEIAAMMKDMDDSDDRMIEGKAESSNVTPLRQITQGAELPMAQVQVPQDDDREPAQQQKAEEKPKQQRAKKQEPPPPEHDEDGVVIQDDAGDGPQGGGELDFGS